MPACRAWSESVEGLSASQREPAAALDEIKSEIAAIRRDIAGRGAADTDHLEQQIRELAARLEAATSADSEGAGMAELEAQVARLASQLEDDQPRAAVLRHVEESLETAAVTPFREPPRIDRGGPRRGARRGQRAVRLRSTSGASMPT